MLRAVLVLFLLGAAAAPAAGLPVCYGHACLEAAAACAPAQPTLVACEADAALRLTGADPVFATLDCWAGSGQGFAPQPDATATGAWCALDSSHTPSVVGVPGLMVTDDGARVCAYLFTNYAFGFRLFCLPPQL